MQRTPHAEQAAGVDAAGAMLGWARSVTTSWAGPKMIDGSCGRVIGWLRPIRRPEKMIVRWEGVILGFIRAVTTIDSIRRRQQGI